MINLNTLTPDQNASAEIFDLSLNGRFALIAAISLDESAVIWSVAETDGQGGWIEIYYASESIEDAIDIFSIYDSADFEQSFDLFNFAESRVIAA